MVRRQPRVLFGSVERLASGRIASGRLGGDQMPGSGRVVTGEQAMAGARLHDDVRRRRRAPAFAARCVAASSIAFAERRISSVA